MGRRRKDPSDDLPEHFFRRPPSPTIFFWHEDINGKRKPACSKKTTIEEAKVVRDSVLERIERRRAAGLRDDSLAWGYALRFVAKRAARSKGAGRFHRNNLKYAEVLLRGRKLESIRRPDVWAWMEELKARIPTGELAPRTVLHAYGSLRRLFNDAIAEGLIDVTPCTLEGGERGELPVLEDKDPEWRDGAVFTREELAQLIRDPRILHVRRVAYALNFISGMRDGELVNRRWRDYDPNAEPLGLLRLATAWSQENKVEKPPKNRIGRKIPVHPMLAAVLAEWKLSGWAKEYGRAPTAEDFIVARPWPRNRQGQRMSPPPAKWSAGLRVPPGDIWKWLNGQWRASGKRTPGDLAKLGLRPRRAHDTRRTFVSLCIEDGANETILRHITHGRPKRAAFDAYPSFTWEKQCEEVKKLCLVRQHEAERAQ